MRLRVHRGTAEIGGTCIEVEHDGQRIVLDLGRPLTAKRGEKVPLPDVDGLDTGTDPSLHGVVLSHNHQDHWGLMPQVSSSVPRYIGKSAADVLRAAQFWGTGIDLTETDHLVHRTPLKIGPFTLTPYLNDHSAFDAYSMVIEAGGDRLFYTGDLRAHGRKSGIFEELLRKPPRDIDLMLCEGTNVHAASSDRPEKPLMTESEVEDDMVTTLGSADGLAVVLSSAQNIDRLVTAYRAARRTGRDLVLDLYSANIAAATGRATIPHLGPDWPHVRCFLPLRQRVRVKQSGEFERTEAIKPYRIFEEQLAAEPGRYVLYGSYQSEIGRLLRADGPRVGVVIWSLWDGYLQDPSGKRLTEQLNREGLALVHHHTSGHAGTADLARMIEAIAPARVVPVHTEGASGFGAVTGKTPIASLADREWIDVPPAD